MTHKDLPLHMRISNAKNELRYTANTIAVKYDLPPEVFDLIIESLLLDEKQQTLAYVGAQMEHELIDKENKEDGDTK